MTVRTLRHVLATAAAVVLVVSGCSSDTTGQPAAIDWSHRAAFSLLRAIPASQDSKFEIGFVDAQALNRIDAGATKPLPTTGPSGALPQSEYAFTNYSISGSFCLLPDNQYGMAGYRTGPVGELASVYLHETDISGAIARCQGGVDLARLEHPAAALSTGAAPSSSDGGRQSVTLKGFTAVAEGGWSTISGTQVPQDVQQRAVSGGTVGGSLADDPDVLAVVRAAPNTAALELGTFFVGRTAKPRDKGIAAAVDSATSAAGAMPTARFGGYGFVPGSGYDGTGVFVTVYDSETDAAQATKVLAAVWPGLSSSSGRMFANAVSTQSGTVVVTQVPHTDPKTFNLSTLLVMDYPAFGGGTR